MAQRAAEKSSGTIVPASAVGRPLKLRPDIAQELANPASIIFWHGVGVRLCDVDISVAADGWPWAFAGAAMAKGAATMAKATSIAKQRRTICRHEATPRADAAIAFVLSPGISMTPMCRRFEGGANDFSVMADRISGLQ
ncbi:MAG: hypothetical protein JSR72_19000 [Proteobacteria bacterium]|nr:hypothetical protein [Pseudomonadota bacterium]